MRLDWLKSHVEIGGLAVGVNLVDVVQEFVDSTWVVMASRRLKMASVWGPFVHWH